MASERGGCGDSPYPDGWQGMEVEGKWDSTEASFDAVVAAFPDGDEWNGYAIRVRWGGRPRKFVDVYYDTNESTLRDALHSLRHRSRWSGSADGTTVTASFEELERTSFPDLDWEKVQYKSTPRRIGAVWFRVEQGGPKLTEEQRNSTLAGNLPVPPYTPDDNPIALMRSDHDLPAELGDVLRELLHVTQYRYRVELKHPGTNRVMYEISLDKGITRHEGSARRSYSVEVEAILEDGQTHTRETIAGLFEVVNQLQALFNLTPTTRSKGGLEVPEHGRSAEVPSSAEGGCPSAKGAL